MSGPDPPPVPGAPAAAPEFLAIGRHSCPACGAEARWSPGKQVLACAYCGTTAPAALDADGAIVEAHDVVRVLRAIGDEQRGWDAARTAVRCEPCGAISLFEAAQVGGHCGFCGATAIVPIHAGSRPIRPSAVLPFAIAESDARDRARAAAGHGASVLSATGVYVPYWRLACDVYVHWHALVDRGTKDHPQYEAADGGFSEIEDGYLEPATRGLPADLLRRIEPFPLEQLRDYDAAYLAGWTVEQYQIDLVAAGDRVRARCAAVAPTKYRRRCKFEVPTRRYTNLNVTATASATTFSHLLLPVWLVQVSTSGVTTPVLVNGATGTASNTPPPTRVGRWLFALAALAILAWLAWRVW